MKAACFACGKAFEPDELMVCHERAVKTLGGTASVTEMYHKVCEPLSQFDIEKGVC